MEKKLFVGTGKPLETLVDIWRFAVEKFPERPAAIYHDRTYSYLDLQESVWNLSAALRNRFGVQRGDRVAIAMPNCIEFVIGYWAIVISGGIVVPINTRLRAEGACAILESTAADPLLVHRDTPRAAERHPDGVRVIGAGMDEDRDARFEDLIEESVPFSPVDVSGDDIAIIMHTSGTTGAPKGAIVSHGDLMFNVARTITAHSCVADDVHLLASPMFHCTACYSILPTSAYLGSSVVVASRPDIAELVDLIERHRVTTFLGVPSLFHFLAVLPGLEERDLTQLRLIAYAGSHMPRRTIELLHERFPGAALRNFFGLTETISVTNVLYEQDALTKADSVGRPLPDVRMKIADEDGRGLPPGEVGEICFGKENVVGGYWGRPDLMEEAMIDGWFGTGDLGMVDGKGYLYLKGRKKDMIIVAGENVYAAEVENAILSHEKVSEVAVVPVAARAPLSYLGEQVKAFVVPAPGQNLTEHDVKRHCVSNLDGYKVPHIVRIVGSLPRNPSGKVLKEVLEETEGVTNVGRE